MPVFLVFVFFAVCILIQLITKHEAAKSAAEPAHDAAETGQRRAIVAGFELPDDRCLHPGHAWALGESPNLIRAGIDDFAAKLIGKAEAVTLPQRGQWIRQGQRVWSFRVGGKTVEMVSPIEGRVRDINDEVVRHPEKLAADPYGQSWLMTVESPDVKSNFRNLLSGSMARNLMAISAKRLASYTGYLPLTHDDVAAHTPLASLSAEEHAEIAKEFFLAA